MVYLGADHRGYGLKEKIKIHLKELGYSFEDLGNNVLDPQDDYSDFALSVAKKVAENPDENQGVLICGSGIGMVVAANKIKGVIAGQVFNEEGAKHAREVDNVNIISIAADYTDLDMAKNIVKIWLETEFSGEERHKRRLDKIKAIES